MKSLLGTLILGTFFLNGCGGIKPGTYPEQGEMKKGPGLFTGEQGEFDILSPQKPLNKGSSEAPQRLKKEPN